MPSTTYQAISSQEYPEFIYYEGKCYRLLPDNIREKSGTIINKTKLKSYSTCKKCATENPQNTLYVRYSTDDN